jgi:hypothetical protein
MITTTTAITATSGRFVSNHLGHRDLALWITYRVSVRVDIISNRIRACGKRSPRFLARRMPTRIARCEVARRLPVGGGAAAGRTAIFPMGLAILLRALASGTVNALRLPP